MKISDQGIPDIDIKVNYMDVVPCKDIMNDPYYYQHYQSYEDTPFFNKFAKGYGMCIKVDPKLSIIRGGGGESSNDIISYQFFPCTLPGGVGCASPQELQEVGLIFSMPSTS